MKKILSIIIISSIFISPIIVSAADLFEVPEKTLENVKTTVINILKALVWTVTIVMFVYAGILFLTSAGAPDKLGKAKKAFIWGIGGVIVIGIGFAIETIVSELFGLSF